jgi:hypothetical protein
MNKLKRAAAVAAMLCATVTAAGVLGGCAGPQAVDAKSTARQREELYKFEERDVTLVGRAIMVDTERYRGPAVELDDKTEVRVPEVKSWPTFNQGDPITIRGRLRRYTPTGTRGAHPDEWFALEAVRWQKGDLAPKKK